MGFWGSLFVIFVLQRVVAFFAGADFDDVLNIVEEDLTIGETVADLGAVAATLDIMQNLEDADYEEYFSGFATIWYEKCTLESRVYLLKNDPHAPCYLRANVTLAQFQQFCDTYGIKEGDSMYVAPEDRLQVW